MSFHVMTSVTCPYCGTEQGRMVEVTGIFTPARLMWCDIDQGGCDHRFAVTPTVVVTATVDALESVRAAYEAQKRAQEAGE
jgi:sarcosine oxidase delta subunit